MSEDLKDSAPKLLFTRSYVERQLEASRREVDKHRAALHSEIALVGYLQNILERFEFVPEPKTPEKK